MTLTVDKEFEHFLTTRPMSVIWHEKPVIPAREIRARDYQEQSEVILMALHSGSEAQLDLALNGWPTA